MITVVEYCGDDGVSGDVGNDDDGADGGGGADGNDGGGGYEGLTLFMVLSVVCCL